MAPKLVCAPCTAAMRPNRLSSLSCLSIQARSYRFHHSPVKDPWAPLTSNQAASARIAVLGGGITGLTAAFYLNVLLPQAKITLIEAGPRFGGWVQSQNSMVNGEEVTFEYGPRSLRPASNASGLATLFLAHALQLKPQLLPTLKDSPASTNRYIFHKDRLLRLPHPSDGLGLLASLFTSPLYTDITQPVWRELWRPGRSEHLQDETIGDFFRRRFSTSMTDNIVSAGIHGIYAGNIDKLSMRTIFPALWDLEGRYGSLGKSVLSRMLAVNDRRTIMPEQDFQLLQVLWRSHYGMSQELSDDIFSLISGSSLYTFRGGLESLVKRLVAVLQYSHGQELRAATLRLNTKVTEVRPSNTPGLIRVSMTGSSNITEEFDQVISALPPNALLSALSTKGSTQPILRTSDVKKLSIASVTVMVVNLYYDDHRLLRQRGFGYLIPQSLDYVQNPEFGLGVVFDSQATPTLDPATQGTKLTVMLGGHWWDGWTSYPSEDEGIAMAKSLLHRQLGVVAEPTKAKATLQKDCIPQYEIGHAQKAADLADKLGKVFGSRFDVAGAGWCGVSVNDCIKSAFKVAWNSCGKLPQFDTLRSVDWSFQPIRSYPRDEVESTLYGTKIWQPEEVLEQSK